MRDWDKTIDELRKNIEDARKKFVFPYLDPTQFDGLKLPKINLK